MRAKQALGLKTDTELAQILGVKHNTLSSWKKRGNIDLVSIVALCNKVNMDWLIFGRGEMTCEGGESGVVEKIVTLLEAMDKTQQREVLKHVQKEELLMSLLQEKRQGGMKG